MRGKGPAFAAFSEKRDSFPHFPPKWLKNKGERRMSIETVKTYLSQWGRQNDVLEFPVSSATVELAAQALHTQPERIAKTLSFAKEDGCILVVAAGNARIDNAKFKAAFGMKAKMLTPDRALELTGHPVGGVCPFALPDEVPVYLDRSLQGQETVFPACGSSNSAICLTPEELALYSHSRGWVDVCKQPENK